jgi:uracil-DNA glycosylase family 4
VLLGEQPGDMEDRRGEPFVGPAGGLLHRALREAGISEQAAYFTNAVKHFRWHADPRGGKRRIHQRPDAGQIAACRPWWQAELRLLRPKVLVVLGASAGEALFGSSFRVGKARGACSTGRSRRNGATRRTRRSRSWLPRIPRRCCVPRTVTKRSPGWSRICDR